MSAFVVEDKTINRIATFLFALDRDNADWTKRKLKELGITNEAELGNAMFKLNCDAVDARYGADEWKTFTGGETYQYDYELTSLIPVIKHLQCWRYQCSEGNVPEQPLYKIMNEYLADLALHVVSNTREYNAAKWE